MGEGVGWRGEGGRGAGKRVGEGKRKILLSNKFELFIFFPVLQIEFPNGLKVERLLMVCDYCSNNEKAYFFLTH